MWYTPNLRKKWDNPISWFSRVGSIHICFTFTAKHISSFPTEFSYVYLIIKVTHFFIHSFENFTMHNKIAQGDVNIFSHLTFFKFVYVFFFIDFTQNFSSNRLNIIKFVIYGFELIEIDTLHTRFQKFQFSRQKFDFL